MNDWKATHRITIDPGKMALRPACPITREVMLTDGAAYTKEEWDGGDLADFELYNGEWLFQGQPFDGTVEKL